MRKTREEKRKAKRKIKQKEFRRSMSAFSQMDKADFLFRDAIWFWDSGRLDKALPLLEKAVRLDAGNVEYLNELGKLGEALNRPEVELKALQALHKKGAIKPDQIPHFCDLLSRRGSYEQALSLIEEILAPVHKTRPPYRKNTRDHLQKLKEYCLYRMENEERLAERKKKVKTERSRPEAPAAPESTREVHAQVEQPTETIPLVEIPISFEVDGKGFQEIITNPHFTTPERYELAIQAHHIRFKETFDNLISLRTLSGVHSFWYQEETARKVLKSFRGRALLADEVGLGKTIEALIVLKEYVLRGMVKSVLILTPSPLVSQWKEEMRSKFGLDFPSTDDPGAQARVGTLWGEPCLLSSINVAKSKRNFEAVTEREYDMVIVDEAHHLKNRNTLNWKLINALKKRFLLLLTATPVENNLMELYNLVTLLKPGQLKTASEFRENFMTRGDPTDPRNQDKLKQLLNQVMIRNTRALARLDIPPRFAQTIRTEPSGPESDLYERITTLVRRINQSNGSAHRLLLKNLLEEAGSSTRAVGLTLSRILQKGDDLAREHASEIQSLCEKCISMEEGRKERLLLDLLRKKPDKVIIFVKYMGTLEHVSQFMTRRGIPHALFHGRMGNPEKDAQIERFREGVDVLLTTEIGGEGRNLQFCHQMINYDLTWNPMKIEQRIGRIHRIGQEKEVMIHNFCAAGTIEDYILEILDRKINMFEMVIGEIDMILGRVEEDQEFSDMVYDIWVHSATHEERKKGFATLSARVNKAKTSYLKTKEMDQKLFGDRYEL